MGSSADSGASAASAGARQAREAGSLRRRLARTCAAPAQRSSFSWALRGGLPPRSRRAPSPEAGQPLRILLVRGGHVDRESATTRVELVVGAPPRRRARRLRLFRAPGRPQSSDRRRERAPRRRAWSPARRTRCTPRARSRPRRGAADLGSAPCRARARCTRRRSASGRRSRSSRLAFPTPRRAGPRRTSASTSRGRRSSWPHRERAAVRPGATTTLIRAMGTSLGAAITTNSPCPAPRPLPPPRWCAGLRR